MKRKTAYKTAIKCIEMRQRYFYTGHLTYIQSGDLFEFAKNAHKNWQKLEDAKQILSDEMSQM